MISRRGLLGWVVGGGAVAAAPPALGQILDVMAPSVECEQLVLPKGYIVPRAVINIADPRHMHGLQQAVCNFVHEVWDGTRFVPLDSEAGRRVLQELGA